MATTKKPAGLKATSKSGSVSREELTQITKALTALTKEVKSLKTQLAEAKKSATGSDEDLRDILKKWANERTPTSAQKKLLSILDSKKI